MLKRFAQTLALIIVANFLFSDGAIAQTRRSQPRRARSTRQKPATNRIQPLSESQRTAIVKLIEKGKRVEYQYNYEPSEFADSAIFMLGNGEEVAKSLPDGNIKNLMLKMCMEYYDAGHLYGRVTRTGLNNTLEQSVLRNNPSLDTIPMTIERYGLQRATPFQAIRIILNIAIKDREFLEGVLWAAPIIPEPSITTVAPVQNMTDRNTADAPPSPPEQVWTSNPLIGNWTLEVVTPDNQRLTLLLKVNEVNGGALNCIIEGSGEQIPCTATGNSFNFTLRNVPIEGQIYNIDLSGSAEADSIKGKLTFNNARGLSVGIPLTGTRIKQRLFQ